MIQLITVNMIEQSIHEAAQILPIIWPLKAAIAINPLWGLIDKPFEEALNHMRNYLPIKGRLGYDEYVTLYRSGKISITALKKALLEKKMLLNDEHEDAISNLLTISHSSEIDSLTGNDKVSLPKYISDDFLLFISRYFDETQLKVCAGNAKCSLWEEWKQQKLLYDAKKNAFVNRLPLDPIKALELVLNKMKVHKEDLTILFKLIFAQLMGWHGLIKWIESRKTNPLIKERANLIEVLLIWCCYLYIEEIKIDEILCCYTKEKSRMGNDQEMLFLWQRALELTYEEMLLDKVSDKHSTKSAALAQFVFCIDVRSEPIRRHLESVNAYETFGYAGFFGSIFSLAESATGACILQAPALVEPNVSVDKLAYSSWLSKLIARVATTFDRAKNSHFSTFAFFEIMGSWMLFGLWQKTFFATRKGQNHDSIFAHTNPFLASENIQQTLKNMTFFLKTIGLVKDFSPVVIICGHQAKTTNNPFHATFECGACGGNSGFINAKITCEILNNGKIRELLSKEGIAIPEETKFIPAYHETTTDKIKVDSIEPSCAKLLTQIENDIERALVKLKIERQANLPGGNCAEASDRAYHYAELIPEWGLINNAAMIIGPRSLTVNADLNGRVFLHSYEPELDCDANILEGILTAPMIVAHWINAQYYFSTTDPEIYGAGNKALHNVVSKIGVMEGNQSDLKIGLPLQSIFFQNKRMHEPLRLLVVVYAEPWKINEIFKRQPQVKSLFDHKWLNLRVIAPRKNVHVAG